MSASEFAWIIRKWGALVVIGGVVAGIAACAVTSTLPRRYEASAEFAVAGGEVDAQTVARLVGTARFIDRVAAASNAQASEIDGHLGGRHVAGTKLVRLTGEAGTAEDALRLTSVAAAALPPYSLEAGTGELELVGPASLPGEASEPDHTTNTILGVALGLFAVALLALVVEQLDGRVESRSHLTRLGVPMIGHVMHDESGRARMAGTSQEQAISLTLAGVRRRKALLSAPVADTPAGPAVVSLARDLAAEGATVLAIEGDLRSPSLASAFALGDTSGLERFRATEPDELIDSVVEVSESIGVLAGHRPADPAPVLNSPAFALAMEAVVAPFDVVLVSGPPVLDTHGDIARWLPQVDGVILLAWKGDTRRRNLQDAKAAIEAAGGHLFGCALVEAVQAEQGARTGSEEVPS